MSQRIANLAKIHLTDLALAQCSARCSASSDARDNGQGSGCRVHHSRVCSRWNGEAYVDGQGRGALRMRMVQRTGAAVGGCM